MSDCCQCEGDVTGDNDNFLVASEVDLSIVCGSSAQTMPTDEQDASPTSKLCVVGVSVGRASMVAVIFAVAG